MAKSASKPGRASQKAASKPSAKSAAKELVRLEKRLSKARDVESKRARQAADAAATVAKLAAKVTVARASNVPSASSDSPVTDAPATATHRTQTADAPSTNGRSATRGKRPPMPRTTSAAVPKVRRARAPRPGTADGGDPAEEG